MVRKQYFLIFMLAAIILTGLSSPVQSQSKVGIKGAFNYSGFRRSPDLKAGYQFGIAGKRYLGDLGWYFQPEINYSLEGVINQPLEFITIPLILGFDFSESFNLHFGYQSSFLIGTRGNEDQEYKTYNPVINAGLEFYPSQKTVFGARYDYGLSDINTGSISSVTINFEVYIIFWFLNN